MRRTYFAIGVSAAVSLMPALVSATDVMSRDSVPHTLTLITSSGTQALVLEPMADMRSVCEGCEITMVDGQSVSAKDDDIVFVENGELSIHED